MAYFNDEHGCYAVDSCAAVLDDGGKGFFDVEDGAREHD